MELALAYDMMQAVAVQAHLNNGDELNSTHNPTISQPQVFTL